MIKITDGRSEFWQWDTGRSVTVPEECTEVHFSNKILGRSIDVEVVGGVASVPDALFQTDKDLSVWAFVGTPESGYTKISKTFKVNRRNRPADYVFTPSEQITLQDLIARVEELEKNEGGGVTAEEVQKMVDEALRQAKEDGEFKGEKGDKGDPGQPGKDGKTPEKGVDYWTEEDQQAIAEEAVELLPVYDGEVDGETGECEALKGDKGDPGEPGKDGYTPVRGVDYWTNADQEAIVQQVIAALGTPVFGTVDDENNIILTGDLADGTYTLKYEDAHGNVIEIGTIEVGGATYTNQIPISTDYDGSVFNGTGYQIGKRIDSGGTGLSDVSNASTASNPVFVTGFIPCGVGSVVRFKNCYMATTASDTDASVYGQSIDNFRLMLANENKVMNQLIQWNQLTSSDAITIEQDENGNVVGFTPLNFGVYIRLVLAGDPATAIITVNEEITD